MKVQVSKLCRIFAVPRTLASFSETWLLTNRMINFSLTECEGGTKEHWPADVFVGPEHSKVCPKKKQQRANIPQYGWSKRGKWVVYYMALGLNLFILNLLAFVNKNTQLMTSMEKNFLVTTNQNIPIYLKTTRPCDKNWYYPLIKCCWSLKILFVFFLLHNFVHPWWQLFLYLRFWFC